MPHPSPLGAVLPVTLHPILLPLSSGRGGSPSFPQSRWNMDAGLRSAAASTLTTSSYLEEGVSPPVTG